MAVLAHAGLVCACDEPFYCDQPLSCDEPDGGNDVAGASTSTSPSAPEFIASPADAGFTEAEIPASMTHSDMAEEVPTAPSPDA